MRKLALAAAVAVVALTAGWLFQPTAGDRPAVALVPSRLADAGAPKQPAVSLTASAPPAGRVVEPPGGRDAPARFLSVLGSGDTPWEAVYLRGVAPGASMEHQFTALQVLQACAPALLGHPYPRIPDASEEWEAAVAASRQALASRCAPVRKAGADHVRRHWAALRDSVESSPLSARHVAVTRRASPQQVNEAADRMDQVFRRYGAAALYWMGPEFGHHIEASSGHLAQRVRTLDPDGRVLSAAIVIAGCRATGICGVDGVPYHLACATGGRCGAADDLGTTGALSHTEAEHASVMADWIMEAIASGAWR